MAKELKFEDSLAGKYPNVAAEWNYEKNGDLTPDKVSSGSNQKTWWKKSYDVPMDYPVEHLRGKHFDFEWEAVVADRARGKGCPYLSGQAIWKGFNDLATVNPELTAEWNYEKNKGLVDGHGRDISTPDKVVVSSNQKVWWKKSYDVPDDYPVESLRGKHFDFEWESLISDRSRGIDCPYLSGKAVLKGFNDLATVNPELAAEWNYEKNGDLTPDKILAGSNQKVWWKKSYDVPADYPVESLRGKHFDFEWEVSIQPRSGPKGFGCPYLSGQAVWEGFNDLATVNPELAAEWNYEKNKGLVDGKGRDISTPDKILVGSNQKVWWKKPYDVPDDYPVESLRGKHFDFEWESLISHRGKGVGCPYLCGKAVLKGFNDLATVNPELAAEWNYDKNGDLTPDKVTISSKQKVWWKKSYDVPDDYPVESLRGKHFDFEWETLISGRSRGLDCPYLSGSAVWKGFNDLTTVNPDVAAEWNYEKNGDLTPDKITIGSSQKVWWKKSYDVPDDYPVESLRGKHFDFEWETTVKDRHGCPYLPPSCSRQESSMYMSLMDNNIDFVRELSYKKSKNSGRFDIYLPNDNMVIECDGIQHFKPIEHFNTERSFDDWTKSDNSCNDFCKEKGIKLLRLPYNMPFDEQWSAVKQVMDGKEIPESIIKYYDGYDFSNYGDVARTMNHKDFGSPLFVDVFKVSKVFAKVADKPISDRTILTGIFANVPESKDKMGEFLTKARKNEKSVSRSKSVDAEFGDLVGSRQSDVTSILDTPSAS